MCSLLIIFNLLKKLRCMRGHMSTFVHVSMYGYPSKYFLCPIHSRSNIHVHVCRVWHNFITVTPFFQLLPFSVHNPPNMSLWVVLSDSFGSTILSKHSCRKSLSFPSVPLSVINLSSKPLKYLIALKSNKSIPNHFRYFVIDLGLNTVTENRVVQSS